MLDCGVGRWPAVQAARRCVALVTHPKTQDHSVINVKNAVCAQKCSDLEKGLL